MTRRVDPPKVVDDVPVDVLEVGQDEMFAGAEHGNDLISREGLHHSRGRTRRLPTCSTRLLNTVTRLLVLKVRREIKAVDGHDRCGRRVVVGGDST